MAAVAAAPFVVTGPPGWVVGGVLLLGAAAYGGYVWYNSPSEVTAESAPAATANDKAGTALKDDAATLVCKTCPPACAYLACGIPGTKYRGGADGCMTKPTGDGKDSHHMPADAYSPLKPRAAGPAIQMDPLDHQATTSYGGRVHGPLYAPQRALLARGQTMAALLMDVAEVKAAFGSKYDGAIGQMMLYAACLKKNGIIQ
jgi:hypothetical protein